jgi:Flp pilus assembly protein TadD
LAPRYVSAHMWLGAADAADGQTDEAIAEVIRAVSLEPLSAVAGAHQAWILYLCRRFREAEAEVLRALEVEPTRGFSLWVLGQIRMASGRPADAVATLERACTLWPAVPGCGPPLRPCSWARGDGPMRFR